jgi:5-oxoprolinase (ATP-hydrolysing)
LYLHPCDRWQFFIDVGGTFTDVLARRPDGTVLTHKLLSSGAIRGVGEVQPDNRSIIDCGRAGDPKGLWAGYEFALVGSSGLSSSIQGTETGDREGVHVERFDTATGRLWFDRPLTASVGGPCPYELRCDEEAPIVAIRCLMGLGLGDSIGPVDLRLGTTRATNALLERKGARTAFLTTKGFGDILKIGYQDRPKLFELNIRQRDELARCVVEIDERLAAGGEVLRQPDERIVRKQLEEVCDSGIEAVAICLLHSYVNPAHEELVASIAESVGFRHVSVSSRAARMQKLVPRGDTTVVDAYLGPVIEEYVARLRRSLPDARIQLMTSNGGLVDAAAAAGKDTILSGPAGGVVGCRHVATQAGFVKTIGFDMGGTSTDVSRVDEPPDELQYQYETVKAGVRIMAPMLAVETVAAGGGSICAFDGQKLVVGPESAGADPGPACYRRGGPLTVTDMNVLLGRVVPEHFPFPLDRTIVEQKLSSLCQQVNDETGSQLEPVDLAEGFIKIANANMAAAIKRISIAKGYDARDYVLTTFGGAGAQHACAIASSLGIRRVLCSPFAGVLSAVGIGVADVKRITQRSVEQPLAPEASAVQEPVFEAMTAELREALIAEGASPDAIASPVRTMDLLYAGQATPLTVPAEPFSDAKTRFEAMHRRLYGYVHSDRAIEIRALRVELSARAEHVALHPSVSGTASGTVRSTTRIIVDAGPMEVPLCLRGDLTIGRRMVGPTVIVEDTSTIVVDPGWEATVTERGDVVLTDTQTERAGPTVSTEADPIQLELFNNQFASIAEQMGTTLRRTALSVNVKERLDFSCAVFTAHGDLVANAPHIPVHLGGMSDCVKALMEDVDSFAPGDVFITNDPYRGGSHLNDVTVVTPVHDGRGRELRFFVASRAHHAEIGGTRPGSMAPDSTALAEEGVVIRAFQWMKEGRPQQDGLRAILTAPPYPSRAADDNIADIIAQVAANQTGAHELAAMVDRYGLDVVHGYMEHIRLAAEQKMRRALGRLPDGVHAFADRLDNGAEIRLAVTIRGDAASFDFSRTGAVLPGNLNANRAIVTSAVLYCLRCLIDEDIPLNAGVLAPVEITLPECFLNPPPYRDARACAAVGGGNVETSQRIVDCVFGALRTVAASQGTMNNLLIGNRSVSYYETVCGGAGGGDGFDGADAVHTHMTNTRLTDPEVLEACVPVRLVRFAIRNGSGGTGRYRGGCGVIREIEFLAPMEVSILSQRRTSRPYGLSGGGDGRAGRNLLWRKESGNEEELPPVTVTAVAPGDRLTIETPGGGGFGSAEPGAES